MGFCIYIFSDEQLILETIPRHMKNKNVNSSSHHGFTKGKSRLSNLINFYSKMTGLVHKGLQWVLTAWTSVRPMTLSQKRSLQTSCWCTGWMSRQRGGWKTGWTAEPRGWWSVAQSLVGGQWLAVYPRDQYWVQSCLTSSLMISVLGQSVPAASLLMAQNWEEWLKGQRAVLPSRETSTAWRNGLTGTSGSSTRWNMKSCKRGGIPHATIHAGCNPAGKQLST